MPNLFVSIEPFALDVDKKELRTALRQVGRVIQKEAQNLIRGAHSGVRYGKHRASAPGEAPATKSGLLARSIKVSARGDTVRVTDSAWYALVLENSAKGGGRARRGRSGRSLRRGSQRTATTTRIMAARPYLSQALGKVDVQNQITNALNALIKAR